MVDLRLKFETLKKKISSNEEADKKLRAEVNRVLEAISQDLGLGASQIKEFHLKNGVLFLRAKNKIVANEFFLRKEEIKKLLEKDKDIKDVVIR